MWRPVARRISHAFSCWALDSRGHGASSSPDGSFDWNGTADDVLAVINRIRTDTGSDGAWFGVGHSMGGAALLLAEQKAPHTFRSLWIFEPIVIPKGFFSDIDIEYNPLAESALRRRATFDSRDAARENYASKPPMNAFDAEALDGYLERGLVERPDGKVDLACAPADESAVYRMGARHGAFDHLAEVTCEVLVARGRVELGPPQFAPLVVKRLTHGRLEEHPDLDHFAPMTDPETIANSILAAFTP